MAKMRPLSALVILLIVSLAGRAIAGQGAKQKEKINSAFVIAKTLSFTSTGPEPMRFDFKLVERKIDKSGAYKIKVKSTATKSTMPTNVKPGTNSYTVTAAHAKEFFADVKDGDHIVFREITKAMKKPSSTNPTDYLYLEKVGG